MSFIPHRLIYYAPEQDAVDLRRGTLTATHPGTVRFEWGGLSVVTECPRLAGHAPAHSTTTLPLAAPDALLLSHVDPDSLADSAIVRHWRDVPTITVPTAADTLGREGCSAIHLLDHWERIVLRKGDASIAVTAIPSLHRPDPTIQADVLGSMLELRTRPDEAPFRIYLSAGSLSIEEHEAIPIRFPEVHMIVVHVAERHHSRMARTTDEVHGRQLIDISRPRRIVLVPLARDPSAHRCMERLQKTLNQDGRGHLVSSPGASGRIRFALPHRQPAASPALETNDRLIQTAEVARSRSIPPTDPPAFNQVPARSSHARGVFDRVGPPTGS